MKNEEAKFLLGAYRPNGADAADPAFGPALAQAKNDPALGAWFAREQALDGVMTARLNEIAPPADLRALILAGARRAPAVKKTAIWRQPVWMAMAAVLVVAFTLAAFWPRVHFQAGQFGSEREWAHFAANDVRYGWHGSHGDEAKGLRAYLSNPANRLSQTMPIDFAKLKTTGCRTVSFGGIDVVELCFERGKNQEFHLYVALHPGEKSGGPMFMQDGQKAVATWSDGMHEFALVTTGAVDTVKSLL